MLEGVTNESGTPNKQPQSLIPQSHSIIQKHNKNHNHNPNGSKKEEKEKKNKKILYPIVDFSKSPYGDRKGK